MSAAPFKVGDIVETVKGAKFWGAVKSVYEVEPGNWRADVYAIDAAFYGTIHVYPTVCSSLYWPRRFDLAAHLRRQKAFSEKTFGPGTRTKGVIDHIRKELGEIEAAPADIEEWVDVIILAFDGAWRAGWEAQAIVDAIVAKQAKNEARDWPDWRTADPDKAIEHVRGEGA